ncbi:MerR family transcriptional regulator [Paenibacillus hemerocallicola]|uniref:MerR family transcriptional regulator n=1 Tax=Paenibacillus hemerocallicola TaxID=1172614 RepID=A0A5C4TH73_9BACL|nr:MerR family transcriptional regulator [Paenibacillus hemerocallicola]TNJ67779.1 MerR family transcriptional regulator [Paenibacillus hemerocallicola]
MKQRTYTIKQFAALTGVSEDTLRYYEKIGLLPFAMRKNNGHRYYSAEDEERVMVLLCLKKAGMSLEEISPFMKLPMDEDIQNIPVIRDMLLDYKRKVEGQMRELQKILDVITAKLHSGEKLALRRSESNTEAKS